MEVKVTELMRQAARQAILPRFRLLRAEDIEEKSPGETVTAADREAEALLTAGLQALLPGALVMGEEATSMQSQRRIDAAAASELWVVDPLDGTANFVAGSPIFAVMVALIRDGETVMSWMLDPLTDTLAFAKKGAGAYLDGQRVHAPQTPLALEQLRGAIFTRFLPPALKTHIEACQGHLAQVLPGMRCSGHEDPAIAQGRQNFVLFWRTEPWDHAPGALFMAEAGAHVARPDGSPYRPLDGGQGLLVADNLGNWNLLAQLLSDRTIG